MNNLHHPITRTTKQLQAVYAARHATWAAWAPENEAAWAAAAELRWKAQVNERERTKVRYLSILPFEITIGGSK